MNKKLIDIPFSRMQLSKSLLLFGTIIIVFSGFNKTVKHSCELYKTGKFYFYNKVTRERISIERRDSLQIETNENGDITVLKVYWTGPCEYELLFNYMTPKEISKKNDPQKAIESIDNTPLRIKILSGTNNYYLFEGKRDGFMSLRDTVWIVK